MASTRAMQWLRPYFTKRGFFVSYGDRLDLDRRPIETLNRHTFDFPSAASWAAAVSRAFFSCLVSGRCLIEVNYMQI